MEPKSIEQLRADAERLILGGMPSFLFYDEVGKAFADECVAKRKALRQAEKASTSAPEADPALKKPAKRLTGLGKAAAALQGSDGNSTPKRDHCGMTGGPHTRDDGYFGHAFDYPLGEFPPGFFPWEAQPEPEPKPAPEFLAPADEDLDGEEASEAAPLDMPADAPTAYDYFYVADEDLDIEEPQDELLPLLPPQEVLDRVELEELAVDAFREKRGEDEHPDDPLTFSTRVPEALLRAFLAEAGIAVTDGKIGQRRLQALSAIIGSALVAGEAGRWVSYSRRRRHYQQRHEYEGQAYTYDCIVHAVDELAAKGWLVNAKAKGGDDISTGLQSKFRASDALRKVFEDVEVSEVGIYNPIRLTDDDGVIVPFKHTRETTLLRRELDAVNTYLGQIHVELPGVERTKHHHIVDGQHVRLSSKPQVVRIFGRKRWDKHGRLYGPWQNLPKKHRLNLLINGMEVIELDYSSLHPTILYAQKGEVFDRDPYAVPGYESMRPACKLALNVGINARSLPQAVSALMERRKLAGDKRWTLSYSETKKLLEAVIAHNQPIADAICSDAGVGLMHTDSRIMLAILKASQSAGIPVLPVHDSVVVPVQYQAEMTAIMVASYRAVVSLLSDCFIKPSFKEIPQMGAVPPAGVGASPTPDTFADYLGPLADLLDGGASGTSGFSESSGGVVAPVSRARRDRVLSARASWGSLRAVSRTSSARSTSLSRRTSQSSSWGHARGPPSLS